MARDRPVSLLLQDARAQVARLEAAVEAKDAALRDVRFYLFNTHRDMKEQGDRIIPLIDAALSDAGKGRLEVREQARTAWARVKGTQAYISRDACSPRCNAENCAIFAMDAALDALGGKP